MEEIKYADFAKVEFKVGEIKEAIIVPDSEKLLRLQVDFGEEKLRTVFSGIRKYYDPNYLVGKKTVFVTNVSPRRIMNEMSEAMIFAASKEIKNEENEIIDEDVSVLFLDKDVPNGSKVY